MLPPFLLHFISFTFDVFKLNETQRHYFNVYSANISFQYSGGDVCNHWPLGITASLCLLDLNEVVFVPKILIF